MGITIRWAVHEVSQVNNNSFYPIYWVISASSCAQDDLFPEPIAAHMYFVFKLG